MESLKYFCFRLLLGFLKILPYNIQVSLIGGILKVLLALSAKHQKYVYRNLELVFPNKTKAEHQKIFVDSTKTFGTLIADFLRMPEIDSDWIAKHVDSTEFEAAHKGETGTPVLYVSGHLGSFELLLHIIGMRAGGVHYIARKLSPDFLDTWWNSLRKYANNELIPRQGALKKTLSLIKQGKSIGFLFDQNVKRTQAVFVPLFGRAAATTKTIAVSVLQTRIPVIVLVLKKIGDRYKVLAERFEFDEIIDSDLTEDQKMQEITLKVTQAFERMLLEFPEGWFWMHRRWRTTPEGVPEDFYD